MADSNTDALQRYRDFSSSDFIVGRWFVVQTPDEVEEDLEQDIRDIRALLEQDVDQELLDG